MSSINYTFAPQGKVLYEYYHDRSPFSVIMGPLGSGKTITTCQKIFKLMCEQPPNAQKVRPVRWLAIRNTYGELLTTTIKDWLALFGELGLYKGGGKEPPTHHFNIQLADKTTLDAEMIFVSADREDHVKKFRGFQVTGLWLNEVAQLPKSIVDILDLRHGRYPSDLLGGVGCGWHGVVGDTNAPDEDHWYAEMDKNNAPGFKFHRQPGGLIKGLDGKWQVNQKAENAANLPDSYYARGMLNKADDWIKVNLANEYGFAVDGKPIYPEFSEQAHVSIAADYIPGLRVYRGWDFGNTPACVFAQIRPNGQFAVFHEVRSDRASIDKLSDAVLFDTQQYGIKDIKDYGDPAGNQASPAYEESACFDVLHGKRIYIEGSDQNPTIRKESLRHTLTRLTDGASSFVIHPRVKYVIKGLKGGYCYRRLRISGERYTDTPDKSIYSHPVEALEYTTAMLFGDRVRGKKPVEKKKPHVQQGRGEYAWMG